MQPLQFISISTMRVVQVQVILRCNEFHQYFLQQGEYLNSPNSLTESGSYLGHVAVAKARPLALQNMGVLKRLTFDTEITKLTNIRPADVSHQQVLICARLALSRSYFKEAATNIFAFFRFWRPQVDKTHRIGTFHNAYRRLLRAL
ncbi:hypothetical protein Bca4012_016873 [Brassica carinata]